MSNYYKTLGVHLRASKTEIKQAYDDRMQRIDPKHPDATYNYQMLGEILEILQDTERRDIYDFYHIPWIIERDEWVETLDWTQHPRVLKFVLKNRPGCQVPEALFPSPLGDVERALDKTLRAELTDFGYTNGPTTGISQHQPSASPQRSYEYSSVSPEDSLLHLLTTVEAEKMDRMRAPEGTTLYYLSSKEAHMMDKMRGSKSSTAIDQRSWFSPYGGRRLYYHLTPAEALAINKTRTRPLSYGYNITLEGMIPIQPVSKSAAFVAELQDHGMPIAVEDSQQPACQPKTTSGAALSANLHPRCGKVMAETHIEIDSTVGKVDKVRSYSKDVYLRSAHKEIPEQDSHIGPKPAQFSSKNPRALKNTPSLADLMPQTVSRGATRGSSVARMLTSSQPLLDRPPSPEQDPWINLISPSGKLERVRSSEKARLLQEGHYEMCSRK